MIDLSTNEIEDAVSHIASTFKLWFPLTSLIRTTGSPPCVMLVANDVVASETFVVVSFFEKSLCKSLLCRRPQLGTLQVLLLQSLDRWPGLIQLKHSVSFWTCSRRSFSFIDLNFSQFQIARYPSLNGHSKFFGFVESSAFDENVLVFGFSRLWNLEPVRANKSSCIKAVDSNQSLKTIEFVGLLPVVGDPVGDVATAP